MIERLRDHPAWGVLGAIVLPIVAILLVTPRFGMLATPALLVYVGMAGWLCSGHRALQEESEIRQTDNP